VIKEFIALKVIGSNLGYISLEYLKFIPVLVLTLIDDFKVRSFFFLAI